MATSEFQANSAVLQDFLQRCPVAALADTAPTLTVAQILNGLLVGVPTAARSYTLPTAAAIVAAVEGIEVGSAFELAIRNDSAGAFALTLVAGTGITLAAGNTNTVAQANTRRFRFVVTNITTAAITVYSLPSGTH